jgi:hypothetical protein
MYKMGKSVNDVTIIDSCVTLIHLQEPIFGAFI